MSTIHFEANFKGNPARGTTGLCCMWAMQHKFVQTTTDQSKVNCTRCAKKLGITPAAKPASKHRTGTCQCCFRDQKVSKGGGTLMSLHGYERPGAGYIIGECRGQSEQPYEVSCEKTKMFKAEVEMMRSAQQKALDALNANTVESLMARVERPLTAAEVADYGTRFKTQYEMVKVLRGEGEKQNHFYPTQPWMVIPSFEKLRQIQIAQTESVIRQMTHHIEFLGEKIASWKQVWES